MLDAASTVPVYYGLAPQGSATPFVTFSRDGANDDYTFTSHYVDDEYSIVAVSDKAWPMEAAAIYESVHAAIVNPTVSGYNVLMFRRQSAIENRDEAGYWLIGGTYRLIVRET